MQLRLLKKFVMFMNMIQYQYVWHKAGSKDFNLEIFISKTHLALADQSLEKSEIMKKVEQDRHISDHIGKKLNIYKTVLNHLEKTRYKKKTRCLGVT